MVIENIGNPAVESYIFFGVLAVLALVFLRLKKKNDAGLSLSLTNELKGWAMIFVVTSHVGYFLFTNHQFLYPLSNIAGVGVDLFLFLSGFGLVTSAYKKPLPIGKFYKRRLSKIFIPLWLALITFLLLDKFLLGQTYQLKTIIESFFGIFRNADIFHDINSPLWYLTLILFYYLTFPFIFMRERPGTSALLWLLAGYYLTDAGFSYFSNVTHLHLWHIGAFPFGVLVAGLVSHPSTFFKKTISWSVKIWSCIPKWIGWMLKTVAILGLLVGVGYWMINPGVGGDKWVLQGISLLTLVMIVLIALLKPFRFRLFEWIGMYSYEIYLLHWPLMYRYDFIFNRLPAGLAMVVAFVWVFGASWLLHQVALYLNKKLSSIIS